ncbi:MAG: cysteine protease StiP family protein [Planctomycetaceae bacterium]
MFSGSYDPDDVIFLLKPVQMTLTAIAEKERLIQSGTRHYSEMLSRESLPSAEYLRLFHEALARHQTRFARDVIRLARRIAERPPGPITLVSLARAGTPIGALLKRVLQRRLGRSASHYSISLIRDRGIDTVALRFLLQSHRSESVVFVDGWTGKGVMSRELRAAVTSFHVTDGVKLDAGLHVIADLSGTSAEAATAEDYLIPCSLLGATISGLVSRSILNAEVVGPGDFHGCVFDAELAPHDLSRRFLDDLTDEIERQWSHPDSLSRVLTDSERQQQRELSRQLLTDVAERFEVRNPNHVKPGIGEATRVLLRRVPSHLLLRSEEAEDVRHLRELAERRAVPVLVEAELPYHAVALIREMDKGDS